jgi:enoyl-CoA hydratase/carnithine racemase
VIDAEPRGTIKILRLDRAEKRNALTPRMLGSLRSHIENSASARAIVLSGVGDIFCAGFDLSLCRDDDEAMPALLEGLSKVILSLRIAPCPVVISAHGGAIAGGCAILGGGDIIHTTSNAKLGYPVVRLGISPAVSAPTLELLVGKGAARALLLDTGLVSGDRAVQLGLAHEVHETPAACEAAAIESAHRLAEMPPHALAYTRRWLDELSGVTPDTLERALQASLSLVGGEEERLRMEAIWNKR